MGRQRKGLLQGFVNTSAAIRFPSDFEGGAVTSVAADSAVKLWAYGELLTVYVETPPAGNTDLLIRDAADTKTLGRIEITNGGAQPRVLPMNCPIYEPWGLKLSTADANLVLGATFECNDYQSDSTAT